MLDYIPCGLGLHALPKGRNAVQLSAKAPYPHQGSLCTARHPRYVELHTHTHKVLRKNFKPWTGLGIHN